ncbi:orotate phosphoribosyltransferase [Paenibacillus sp. FJAT-26967]|uniref:orotate phosphoribosyltransferase n=1 Tax=Paenibacillus sp. FJAT-26967 TaxID=1729690 RepID=UPI000838C35D|nr:phosphoribosyltransferase family protein [Paenibacillus sp. FJAT-26967]
MNPVSIQTSLTEIVRSSVQYGDYILKDGTPSTFFVDGRVITSHPSALTAASTQILDKIVEVRADAIAGEDTGATPIIGALLVLAELKNVPLQGAYIRKTQKNHGVSGLLTTSVRAGSRYVLIDDVSSSGDTLIRCAEFLRGLGAEIVLAISILDRQRGADIRLREIGVPLFSLFQINEINQTDS